MAAPEFARRAEVQIRRPRVRTEGEEVALPTFLAFADTDPLNRRVVEQLLVGVATRQNSASTLQASGSNSVVESRLPKPLVAGSIPVSRSSFNSLPLQQLSVVVVVLYRRTTGGVILPACKFLQMFPGFIKATHRLMEAKPRGVQIDRSRSGVSMPQELDISRTNSGGHFTY